MISKKNDFKPIKDFPEYMINSNGDLINSHTLKIINGTKELYYRAVILCGSNHRRRRVKIHQLVAETFMGAKPSHIVCIKDKSLGYYGVDNLEVVPVHSYTGGGFQKGNQYASNKYKKSPLMIMMCLQLV